MYVCLNERIALVHLNRLHELMHGVCDIKPSQAVSATMVLPTHNNALIQTDEI